MATEFELSPSENVYALEVRAEDVRCLHSGSWLKTHHVRWDLVTRILVDGCEELKSLPPLPPNLDYFSCSWSGLRRVPALPAKTRVLKCERCYLEWLPRLPESLETLDASENLLTWLPTLPGRLKKLRVSFNDIKDLGALPLDLLDLEVRGNRLTLRHLPPGLRKADLSGCCLTSLPELVDLAALEFLDVSENSLTSLPELPGRLGTLFCSNNSLTSLPDLKRVRVMSCQDNLLTSLPASDRLLNLEALRNPLGTIPYYPKALKIVAPLTVIHDYQMRYADLIQGTEFRSNGIKVPPLAPRDPVNTELMATIRSLPGH